MTEPCGGRVGRGRDGNAEAPLEGFQRIFRRGSRGFAFRESAEAFSEESFGELVVKHRERYSGSGGDVGLPRKEAVGSTVEEFDKASEAIE